MAKKSKARHRAVQIEVRASGVHGRGVYAAQFIPEGARVRVTRVDGLLLFVSKD